MDPNAWNFNPQAYGRLPPGAMAGNPRLDVIDQAAVAAGLAPGLQALSPPLPAHSNLQPTIGYSLQSSLSQIMDSINYGGYKSVPVGQPAFTLETPSPRTVTDHATSLRYPPVSSSASSVKSMFDTDPHTMRETQSSTFSSASPASATEATPSWSLSNFLPGPTPTAAPFVGLHGESSRASSYGNSQPSVSLPEPPPAHSGPRTTKHSMMSRTPYPGRHDFHSHTHAHQAKPAHSQYSVDHSLQDLLERERSVHAQHRSVSHSNYEHQTSSRTQNSRSGYQSTHQSAPPPSQQPVRPSSNQSTYSDSGRTSQNHSGYQNTSSSQQRSYRNSSHIQTPRSNAIPPFNNYEPGLSSPGFSSNSTSNGNSRALDNSISYEAVSPATPSMSDSSTIDTSAINTTMSLQDFADISASQEKMPLQERVLHNSGQLQRSPHLTNTLQDMSPVHQQSPMQPSPISATGSPQVPMSMGSPPGNISSSIQNPKNPVQAVADSTTKPKKRTKKKKAPPSIRQLAPPGSQQEIIAAAMREAQFEQSTFSSNTYMASQANAIPQNYEQQQSMESTSNSNTEFLVTQTQSVLDQFDPVKTTPLGEPIFMTNVFGNEFVNPNESSGTDFPHISEAGGDNMMSHPGLESDHRLKQRTKAEQKQMPTMTVQSDVDEEFAHLSEAPQSIGKQSYLNGHSNPGNFNSTHSRGNPHDSPLTDPNIPHPGNPNPKPQASSGFQGSFLSFLQGKKPETLSSVTNSTVVKKPELPKYIPEPPRPRPPPRPPSPKTKSHSSTNFSDDDDSEKEEMNKTVASVISNLSEPGDSKSSPPIRMKIKLKGLISQPSKKPRSKIKGSKSKSKKSSMEDYPTVVLDDEVEVIPRRQSSSRRAKEKVEEKRKKRQKKKKRKSRTVSDDSSFEASDSDEDFVLLSSESEKEYDSDKDPAWNPFGEPVKRSVSSDEEDGPGKKGKHTFKKMKLAATPGVRRGSKQSVEGEEPQPAVPRTVLAHPVENEVEESDPNQVHNFKRGDFVIDKKDLTKYQEFPIWKIDAGRLLQKYEPFMKDGKLTHKSLSTYSSWSDTVKESFQPIKVNMIMCSKGIEFVEVQEQFLPKPPPSEGEETHPLTDSFYIYMQILLSQSLAPGFLKTIKDENESYYTGPLEKIDHLIDEKVQLIETKVKWLPKFKESLDSHPFLHVIDMPPHPSSECQATSEPNQSALKVIQLHGEKYDRETLASGDSQMQEDFKIGPMAAQYVEIYHGLKHFKYCLYKKCLAQVAALQESKGPTKSHDILDQCLENKNWVLAILKNLDELLKKSETGS